MTASDGNASDRVLSSFGITFEVFRGAPPNETVVAERLIPSTVLKINVQDQEVVLELDAYGEQKEKGVQGVRGNTVKLFIPREALTLLSMEFDQADQREKLLARNGR